MLHKILEEDVLFKNLLGKFSPLIVKIAKRITTDSIDAHPHLYKSALLSLCKFMCISQRFCEEHLPFIFELLKADIEPELKLNVCAAFGDFIIRFPNTLQKHINKFFDWYLIFKLAYIRKTLRLFGHPLQLYSI
jgi:condensin complex subunit 1